MTARLFIALLFFVAVSCASGNISLYNEYFTEGATVQESMDYHNMNFDNSVFIDREVVSSISHAEPAGDGTRSYSEGTRITSNDGTTMGGYVGAKGDLGSVSSSVVGGKTSYIGLDYSLGSGDVNSGSYNAYTSAGVRTHMENTHSSGSVSATSSSISIYEVGSGTSYGNAENIGFEQDTWLSHMGKVTEIDSGIKMIRKEGLKPVTYGWSTSVGSYGSRIAESEAQINIGAGDCDINASILGTSSALSTKETKIRLTPLEINNTRNSNPGDPWADIEKMIDLLKRSAVEKKLFMSYVITP